uniref:Uncharacterized protein n=1 Tax=Tarenaya spinosa TaxID=228870 RepID=Q1KUX7_9ROSI|nr:hypothetical protein [Tarenaya spinosa]
MAFLYIFGRSIPKTSYLLFFQAVPDGLKLISGHRKRVMQTDRTNIQYMSLIAFPSNTE